MKLEDFQALVRANFPADVIVSQDDENDLIIHTRMHIETGNDGIILVVPTNVVPENVIDLYSHSKFMMAHQEEFQEDDDPQNS